MSIALVSKNRPERLEKALYSLSLQNVKPFEIVLSDDSDKDDCIEANKVLSEQYCCRYISGPKKGLYANRNFVAKHAAGTHIRTMDDDHEFPQGHIQMCLQAIKAEPDTIWTIGEYNKQDTKRTKPYPIPGQLHPKGYAYKPKDFADYYGISCGGTIYPRKVIDDNHLNVDVYKFGIIFLEYGARLKHLGYTIKVLSTTYIIHDDSITTASQFSSSITNEARIYSMLCLSFRYKPSLKNKMLTTLQLGKYLFEQRIRIKELKNAYKQFRLSYKL